MIKPKQLLIGITGGIGSGKTIVCHKLSQKGFKVFYADLIAKELYNKDAALVKKLVKAFSPDILNYKGKIHLPKLKEIIFKNKKNYELINKIVHPVVIDYINNQIKKTAHKVVLIEAALIFESGFDKYLDYIITVYANKKLRIERIMLRDGAKKSEVERIMKYQINDKQKLELSDFVIINNKDLPELDLQIEFITKVVKALC